MQALSFHHIGIATVNIEESIALYQKLGYEWQGETVIEDPIQKVLIAFMYRSGHPLIELVGGIDAESPIQAILQKSKTTPYHTCYEVPDIEKEIQNLKTLRFIPTTKPVPAIAFQNRLICFLYHRHFGLIELLQA
jgi:methylmalonyl-CoA/ethylmalonyl-CoA epimerase